MISDQVLGVKIILPVEVIALMPKVKAFQDANRYTTAKFTEWHSSCSNMKSLVNWNNRAFNDNLLNNIEFSACAARAYSGLFQLSKQDIPYCLPSDVVRAANLAKETIGVLSNIIPLPEKAASPAFKEGLISISQWRSSDIPAGASGRGNPIIRWLINKIAEEFYYSFNPEPTVSIIGDLVRLGWPDITDRSIRNTFTDELSLQALKTAQIRRENDNKSKVITHQVISALPSSSKGIATSQPIKELSSPICKKDNHILEYVAEILNKPDSSERRRFISIVEAMQYDEQNHLADNGN